MSATLLYANGSEEPIALICDDCGRISPANAPFCINCGAAIGLSPSQQAAPPRNSVAYLERRVEQLQDALVENEEKRVALIAELAQVTQLLDARRAGGTPSPLSTPNLC